MENEDTFMLTDEDGNDLNCKLVDFYEYENTMYAIFAPEEYADKDEVAVVIMKAEYEDDEPVFTMLEDEELCNEILDSYIAMTDEEDNEPS
jgi:uncharacterized protein YrzB (UPF0473 family)